MQQQQSQQPPHQQQHQHQQQQQQHFMAPARRLVGPNFSLRPMRRRLDASLLTPDTSLGSLLHQLNDSEEGDDEQEQKNEPPNALPTRSPSTYGAAATRDPRATRRSRMDASMLTESGSMEITLDGLNDSEQEAE
jgi:hypothetical protein